MIYEFEDGQKILLFTETNPKGGYFIGVPYWELSRMIQVYIDTLNVSLETKTLMKKRFVDAERDYKFNND